ncbi:MAG TPA: hypothetical protein VIZ19_04120, partial [Roseiarcus sp.]
MAKNQLPLLAREWYMNPNGQLPAYEWNFSDVNPPVQAWAALAVFRIDGANDFDFLARVFNKLLINFTWGSTARTREATMFSKAVFWGSTTLARSTGR